MCQFYDSAEDTPSLEFQGAGWHRSGHKMVACADNFTVVWLIGTVDNLSKSTELERKAIIIENLKDYAVPRGWLWVPPPAKPIETVLKLITKQNTWLNTTGWSVSCKEEDLQEHKGERKMGFKYYLSMTRESLPALKEKEFVIQYSLAKAVIYLFNRSNDDAEFEVDPNKPPSL